MTNYIQMIIKMIIPIKSRIYEIDLNDEKKDQNL